MGSYQWVKSLSHVRLFATPWTVAYQAPPSMGFSRQECWSGLPFPSPGDLPDPGIEPGSPTLQADTLPSKPPGNQTWDQIHVSCIGRQILYHWVIGEAPWHHVDSLKYSWTGVFTSWKSANTTQISHLFIPRELVVKYLPTSNDCGYIKVWHLDPTWANSVEPL